ncbi:MAG: FkbM family methyltransferase [Planctomycetota bacterium]
MQVVGTEYGGWAVDLDLVPFGSTVISAGVGEDISFDLGLINLKDCKVIGIDPTEKAKKYVEKNKNERFDFLQKALYFESSKKIKIYKNTNPDYVSESIVPSHNMVAPSEFYEAETINIQDLLKKCKNVSVLKMDIEGAEYQVLNSISKLDIPQICVEFHHFCTDFTVDDTERCIQQLNNMGYAAVHCTRKDGAPKQATFVHKKYISRKTSQVDTSEPKTHITKDIPVVLVCYNRPRHTLEVLKALKQYDVKNIYIFSDAPKRPEDVEAVSLTRRLVHSIDWTKPTIIERTENLGLAQNIVTAVDYAFERYDRLILLEDDCVPQRYFFDFIQTCLEKYENNSSVFGISGYTVSIQAHLLKSYPHDLYFCPRIGSWGWATWKRAWQHHKGDLRQLLAIANERNIDLTQGGTDIPISVENFLKGQLQDVWTLNWVLSVYVNKGLYIYPTKSHVKNIGMDGTGLHCGKTDKYDSRYSDTKPFRYPADVFLDKGIMKNFKSYYQATAERSQEAVDFLKSLPRQKALKIAQINTVDKKGGAAKVAWMLKEGLKAKGFQTKMFVKENFSGDDDVQIITNPAIDNGDDYKKKGFLYYDINSTSLLSGNDDFISSDMFHFHNLHGDYFNPFALSELTKIRPSVWTLHDMQSITGHCAYAFDCLKWQSGCGDCPDIETYPAITADRTAQIWEDKRQIYQKSDIELIVPSQWLKDTVEKSILRNKKIHLIYNGIDEHIYKPDDKHAIRRMFKIPHDAIIISFVAHGGLIDKRKGGDFILKAYSYFVSKYPNVYFICVGGNSPRAPTKRFLQIPFVLDESKLVQLYCATDIFLFPTLADNCPLVILEVMGCGVPIVSFNTGGVPELIEHGKTGLIAEFKNGEEFIRMIEYLIGSRAKREEFAIAGRERLLKMFTLDRMIDKHIRLYEELAERANEKNYVRLKNKLALPTHYTESKYEYLVSAIVSTYNSERYIRGCLEDLEQQTVADKLEIIVVNSGSQQNEEAIVKEFQQTYDNIVYIKTEHREGVYAAWNRAVKAARGKFITNANTDDRHRKDALEIMARTLQANPDIALVYGDQRYTDTPNGTFANHHSTQIAKRPEYSRERLLLGCCVGSQPMWRKSLHNEFGHFDETLTCAGDWDFWLSISSKYKFKHIPEFLGLYYYNENGIEHGRKIHSLYERYIVGKRYGTPYISVIPLHTNQSNPLVSIIMPTYNAAEHIAEAIESVLIQNYRNFELIIVDDGSIDNTRDIIAGFKDEKIKYFYKENAGAASARNLGIKKSQGAFLIHLDSDDMITPDFLAKHLQQFEKHPEADLVYCDDYLIDENDKPIRVIERSEYPDQKSLIRDLFRSGFPVVPFRTCIRRSVFDKIGFFDEDLLIGEDYDMMRRFVKSGLKIHHLKGALYLRRMASDSLSRNYSAQKAKCLFDVLKRFTDTFAYDELFPNVAWDKIPAQMRQLHAKCLTAVTYLAVGQDYVKSNSPPIYAKMAFEQACSELNGCLKIDPNNRQIQQLLQKCEFGKHQYDEQIQQAVC